MVMNLEVESKILLD